MQKITIAAARKNMNLTQDQMAKRLGVSRKTICNWEAGRKKMRKANAIAFSAITGFSEDELILP